MIQISETHSDDDDDDRPRPTTTMTASPARPPARRGTDVDDRATTTALPAGRAPPTTTDRPARRTTTACATKGFGQPSHRTQCSSLPASRLGGGRPSRRRGAALRNLRYAIYRCEQTNRLHTQPLKYLIRNRCECARGGLVWSAREMASARVMYSAQSYSLLLSWRGVLISNTD